VKRICRQFPLLALPLLCASFVSAQSQVDFGIGFGSNHAKSNGQSIETFGDGKLYSTPALGGFFMNLGGNIMLYPHFGVGAQVAIQPGKPDYAGLQARTSFYDFNAIYSPVNTKKASLQLIGGLGAANMRFYYSSQFCSSFSGCSSQNQFLESSNHFALHTGAAVQFYVTEHVFIRPQFDVHYVKNFFQFGSNVVPGGAIWVGYSLGDR
jgi:hypothetical protein